MNTPKFISIDRVANISRRNEVRRVARTPKERIEVMPAFAIDAQGLHVELRKPAFVVGLPMATYNEVQNLSNELAKTGSYINTPNRLVAVLIGSHEFAQFARAQVEKMLSIRGTAAAQQTKTD